MSAQQFQKLFQPGRIGKLEIRNRIAMAPMTMLYAGLNGEMTDQCIAYYEARAKGGTGLIIVEAAYINPSARQLEGSLYIGADTYLPGWSRLVDAIKLHGATAVLQLIHAGIQAHVPQPLGPSPVGRALIPPVAPPKEMTTEEVEKTIEDFASAADRAKRAGFDGVEVHGTHGYLILQFLSPLTNKRTDAYGTDKGLFAEKVVTRIKEKCGHDYPVIFRLCASEFLPGGVTLEDAKALAKRLETAGVDAFHVTVGNYDVLDLALLPIYVARDGAFLELASEIKKTVNVPIIGGGAVSSPELVEKAITDGLVDIVFMGRQLIADPEWVRKVREGRPEDIRPCSTCGEGCLARIFGLRFCSCAINPLVGLEYKWMSEDDIPEAKRKQKVLIIGGGPGGLECARMAAIRGHEVTIVDKNAELGGTFNIAAIPSFKKRFAKQIDWYKGQLGKLAVRIMTNTTADSKFIRDRNPDIVVVATGSEPLIPSIPGIEKTVTADDVLLGKVSVGENVVIVGGGLVGVDTALHLAEQGKKVTIVEALPAVASDMEPVSMISLIRPDGLFAKRGINIMVNRPLVEVRDGEIVTTDDSGARVPIKADTVILAVGRKEVIPEDVVSEAKRIGKRIFVVGDAKTVRKGYHAVHEGFAAALDI
ncbi:NADH oxidase [subsurface metagenome]